MNPRQIIRQNRPKLAAMSRHDNRIVGQVKRPKVGRNDPCPCGSRDKYKRCCGRDEEKQAGVARYQELTIDAALVAGLPESFT